MSVNHQRIAQIALLADVSLHRTKDACERLERERHPSAQTLRITACLLRDAIKLLDELSERATI